MSNSIIFKTTLKQGAKGERGVAGGDIPEDSVIFYEGESVPEGYEATTAPPSTAFITELTLEQYEALPDTKLTNGVLYAIKDA